MSASRSTFCFDGLAESSMMGDVMLWFAIRSYGEILFFFSCFVTVGGLLSEPVAKPSAIRMDLSAHHLSHRVSAQVQISIENSQSYL